MKKTVFISSTFVDLEDERREIWKSLEKFNVIVKGMERFGARPEDSLSTCLNEVEQSDIYIGIIGVRFGSIDGKSNKSYTQLEYEKALATNKIILVYLMDTKTAKVVADHIDIDNQEKLKIFKEKLRENHTVDFFKDSSDLVDKLNRKFKTFFDQKKLGNDLSDYDTSINTINRFFLTPKSHSGKEVKLRIKILGKLFPASQLVCSNFGLVFGKTVGVPIKVIEPALNTKSANFHSLFIEGKYIDEFLELSQEEVVIYATVLFSETQIAKLGTTFLDKKTEVYIDDFMTEPQEPVYSYTRIDRGEGQVLLVLKEIIRSIPD
ncbi:DUF4062 domain-containing protein [bacterium SCSIO 12741]|nr:DUF4062 domain-containing protein [bacterium SCSIO 12741]